MLYVMLLLFNAALIIQEACAGNGLKCLYWIGAAIITFAIWRLK